MGFVGVADAVIELCHIARAAGQVANELAKALKAAALFRNGHRKNGFAFFTHFGALGHKAQAVKVHVGAAQNGGIGFAFGFVFGHILFDGCHGQCTCRFHNRASVHKHILDGGAHRVGVDGHVLVDQAARHAEGFFAHQFDGRAIREQTNVIERDAFLGVNRLNHGVRVVHLHTNDLHIGAHSLDVVGHARNQTTAANGHKHRIQAALVLAQNFHGDGALARNHFGVVKGMHKGHAHFFLKHAGVFESVRVAVTHQHHFAAQSFDGIDLHLWCGGGHHNHSATAQFARAQRDALGMVAGGGANHALFELRWREVRHFVVRTAQLKAVHGLLVFALEQHGVVQAF